MTALPRNIAIAGLGLIGGSLARALRAVPHAPRVIAADPDDATRAAALDADVVAAAFPTLHDLPPADLLVLAGPVSSIVAALEEGARLATHGAITDVGSVKAPLVEAAAAGGVLPRYAGSHPLCGDHRSGFAAARGELFAGSTIYVMSDGPAAPRLTVTEMWRAVGGRVVEMSAASHDELVARTSHLPQAAATALALVLAEAGVSAAELGPGGRDATRLAASDARMWLDIFTYNRAALGVPLARLEAIVHALRAAIDSGDETAVLERLKTAAAWRRA